MLMQRRRSALFEARREIYGIVFLLVVSLLIWLAVAAYQKRFTPFTTVTLMADSTGNQLAPQGEVKLRGVVVGEVRKVTADGDRAIVTLGLYPDRARSVPENIRAELLPKTLFGERDVHLLVIGRVAGDPIKSGAVIPQDRTETGLELQRVLDSALPLLRKLDPGKLNAALSALADAFEGRGEKIGQNIERVDDYLRQIEPHLPTLYRDIASFATVSNAYADAAPDVLRVLANSVTTSRTIAQKQQQLRAVFSGVTEFSGIAERVLEENGDRLIRVASTYRPVTEMLARYSPEYPCMFRGLVDGHERAKAAFTGGRVRVHLEFVPGRPPYQPGEEPRWGETRGPGCAGLPNPPVPLHIPKLKDGTDPDRNNWMDSFAVTSGFAGTAAEQKVVGAILAPVMGVPADEVPPMATLLWAPMVRGTEVNVA